MTFYNVISGILFLLTWQAAIAAQWWQGTAIAVLLFALIVNEAIGTSQLLETDGAPQYSDWMKFVDLGGFVSISVALATLTPLRGASGSGAAVLEDRFFWGGVLVYWGFLVWWNHLAGQFAKDVWPAWMHWVMFTGWIPLAAGFIYAWPPTRSFDSVQGGLAIFQSVVVVSYMVAKARKRAKREARVHVAIEEIGDQRAVRISLDGTRSWMTLPSPNVTSRTTHSTEGVIPASEVKTEPPPVEAPANPMPAPAAPTGTATR